MRILISAGEPSGDLYAARLAEILRARHPSVELFGCAGPRMRAAGVETVVDQASLAVVGIVEVLAHIPRIYGEFRKLVHVARERRPDLAILTDSPDFHLRLAAKLRALGIPVVYLIAPQVWAWREGRVRTMRRDLRRLFCIFPFEEAFFAGHGVPATYIGHPLARVVKATLSRAELGLPETARILALLPGSRHGEAARHIPDLLRAAGMLRQRHDVHPVLALPKGFNVEITGLMEPIRAASIHIIEGHTWDVLAHAELALAASGTVTIEAALLGTPMVTFYRVNALTWYLGRWMVKAPFLSMVNLVAERPVVPELIQHDMTPERLAAECSRLLDDPAARQHMRAGLAEVAAKLASERDPMDVAADWIETILREGNQRAHVA